MSVRLAARVGGLVLGPLLLAGCATGVIGPDFVTPAAPDVERYTADPLPSRTASAGAAGGQSQVFQIGGNVPGRWWELFNSPVVNRLVEQALAANPDLASAQQSLISARADYVAGQAQARLPSVSMSAIQVEASTDNPFFVQGGSLSVDYSIDLCCGAARSREASQANLSRQEAQLRASYLSMTANVVNTAINLASLQERIDQSEAVLALQQELVGIAEQRVQLGDLSEAELASQQTEIINSRSSLVQLQSEWSRQRNQLAIYLGVFPSQMADIDLDLDDLTLPTNVPVSLPSQLVAQRPDILQATYSLEAATAQVGVTLAGMLPQITLSSAFNPAGAGLSIAASIVQAAINIAANERRRESAEASLEAAARSYESTVISAFVDVANALEAITSDAQLMSLQVQAEAQSRRSLDLSRQQYELGTQAYSSVLDAQQSWRNAVSSLVSARAQRMTDTVALYVALGGGWWNVDETGGNTVVAAN